MPTPVPAPTILPLGTIRTCANCIYFDSVQEDCHYFPPTVVGASGPSIWPGVAPTDWCGQHEIAQVGLTFPTQSVITRTGASKP